MLVGILVVCFVAAVSVADATTNVALNKDVSQSSIWSPTTNPASYAVDGDTSSTFGAGGHCAHTASENGPYITIDLGDSYNIHSFELWVREKCGTARDLRDVDFEIRIGNSPDHLKNPVCYKYDGAVPVSSTQNCASILCGRYVSIQRLASGSNVMQVCEIMAYTDDTTGSCASADEGHDLNPDSFVSVQEVNIVEPTGSFQGNRFLKLMSNQPVEVNTEYYFSCKVRLLKLPSNHMWLRVNLVVVIIPRNGRQRRVEFGRIGQLRADDGWVDFGGDFITNEDTAKVNVQIDIKERVGDAPLEISSMQLKKIIKNPRWKEEANFRIDLIRKGRVNLSFTNPKKYSTEQLRFKLEQVTSSFPIGSSIQGSRMGSKKPEDRKYQEFFTENFNWGVPENDLKWRMMENKERRVTFRNADSGLNALESRNYGSRGHCVFWGRSKKIPSWLKNEDPATVREAINRRMDYIAEHYGNSIDHWDVNNEQLHERWYAEKFQDPNMLSWMFKEFHARVPNSKLFVNDFYVFGNGVLTQAYKHQVQKLLNDSAPVYGIGIQAHFGSKISPEVLAKRLAVISEAGLPIWLTEFDVVLKDEEEQLELMEDVLRLAFSHPQVEGIVFWGFWDKAMWRKQSALASGSQFQLTAQGRLFKKLFFDEWRTNEDFTVANRSDLTWATDAFYGTYRLTARLNDNVLWSREFELNQCDDVFFEVEI